MKKEFRQKFYDIYMKEVLPQMMFLEPERQKQLRMFWIIQLSCIVIFLTCIIWYTVTKISPLNVGYVPLDTFILMMNFFIVPAILFLAVAEFFFYKNRINKFKKLLKMNCMHVFVKSFGNLTHSNHPKTALHFDRSNLFGDYNKIEYDDTFHGIYKDVAFDAQEVKLIHEGDKHTHTSFRGIVICMPSNKIIKAHTIVTTKGDLQIKNRSNMRMQFMVAMALTLFIVGVQTELELHNIAAIFLICVIAVLITILILTSLKGFIYSRGLKKVNLEDLNFSKEFAVESRDQIEARYLVTPAFMERLKNLETAFGTKNIKCSFFEDKIMFAISTKKDLFEIGNLFVPLSNSKQVNEFYEQIISIYEMIDYFKLAQKTGL